MTEREMAEAVEKRLSGEWQCRACLEWCNGRQPLSAGAIGPWCADCWDAYPRSAHGESIEEFMADRAGLRRPLTGHG